MTCPPMTAGTAQGKGKAGGVEIPHPHQVQEDLPPPFLEGTPFETTSNGGKVGDDGDMRHVRQSPTYMSLSLQISISI